MVDVRRAARMAERWCARLSRVMRAAPVVRHGRLVGLLTMENVGESLSFRRVLAR